MNRPFFFSLCFLTTASSYIFSHEELTNQALSSEHVIVKETPLQQQIATPAFSEDGLNNTESTDTSGSSSVESIALCPGMSNQQPSSPCSPCMVDDLKMSNQQPPASSLPLTNEITQINFFLTGDFLYWNASFSNSSSLLFSNPIEANSGNQSTPPNEVGSYQTTQKVLSYDRTWDPGFRVGFDFNTAQNHWNFSFLWTHFNTHTSQTTVLKDYNAQIFPFSFTTPIDTSAFLIEAYTPENIITQSKSAWKLRLEDLEFLMTKTYLTPFNIAIHFGFGLKSTWLLQKYSLKISNGFINGDPTLPIASIPSYATVKANNNSWGIGPEISLDSNWFLGGGFSFFSELRGSLLATQFNTFYHSQPHSPSGSDPGLDWKTDAQSYHVNPYAKLALGLAWERTFKNKNLDPSSFLKLNFGYELSYYWNQVHFQPINMSFLNSVANIQQSYVDIALQGLTVSASLGF